MNVEDLVLKLKHGEIDKPICWMISYEDRPLQVEPSSGAGPHLLIFSSHEKASQFLELRKKHYHSETLQTLAVDIAGALKKLATFKSSDPDYTLPPCGLMLDFDYSTGNAIASLAPSKVDELAAKEIIMEIQLGLKPKSIPAIPVPEPVKPKEEIPLPTVKTRKQKPVTMPPPLPIVGIAASSAAGPAQPPVKPAPVPLSVPAKPPAYPKGSGHGWIRQGKTVTEKLNEQREKLLGGANTRVVSFEQVINLADLISKNEPGTFSMYVVNGEPHLLAKMPPPPADVKGLFMDNIKSGAILFRTTHYEYPTFPVLYCRLFFPLVKEFKAGHTRGAIAEAPTIFSEANFQEWVNTVERTHNTNVIVYDETGAVLAQGRFALNTEAILFLVQEVDSANQCLSKIPESKRDFKAASNQFFKDHPEPYFDEPERGSVVAAPKPPAVPVVPVLPLAGMTPVFIGKRTNPAGTYEDYRGTDAESAKVFLLTKKTSLPQYYIRVETQDGNWGMDKEGLYLERLLPWQMDVSKVSVQGEHDFSHSIFSVAMAKKGITDNFVLGVTCGKCQHKWHDGVRYQATTAVKCPNCKTLNKVDTTNISIY